MGSTNPAFEHITSTFTTFVCWEQVTLATLGGGNLTQAFQGTRKGVFIAGQAQKEADGNAPNDHPIIGVDPSPFPVTLIALVETVEGTAANGFLERKYNFNTQNNSVVVPTVFVPLPVFP